MVSARDLTILGKYELMGEQRFRICVKGTNIVVNVTADSEEDAIRKALEILGNVGLTDEALERVRRLVKDSSKCG